MIINTKDQKHVVHFTMKNLEEKLRIFNTFYRVHRSYIINIDYLESINESEIMIKGIEIPLGKSYKQNFLNQIKTI
jgi:DNA-binding LytR/AlgR family response regulator